MSFKRTGNWAAFEQLATTLRREIPKAVAAEASGLRDRMVEGIQSGAPGGRPFAPHAALTIRFGGKKPLVRTGALVGAISVFQTGPATFFVGVRGDAARIGAIHEYGANFTQTWTEKQRRFFFAQLKEARAAGASQKQPTGGGTVVTIRIPARPFVAPIAEVFGPVALQRIIDRVAAATGLG